MGKLQDETGGKADCEPNDQAAEEDHQEDADAFEEAEWCQLADTAVFVLLCSLKQDDGDSIIQNALSEDDGVQFRVDLVGVEDCEDRDRVRR